MPSSAGNLIDTGAYHGRTVLVTGGAGFIGSHLVHALAALGANVRVLDDLSTGRAENLVGVAHELEVGSILDEPLLRRLVDGCRVIFHEAAMVSVPLSVENPGQCAAINISGTERVLEAARDAGVRRVVLASSSAVYGDEPRLPSQETDPIDCRSPYAASKAAGEGLMAAFDRCYDLSTVSLRYFNIFGPRQDPNSSYAAVIVAFLTALDAGASPTIFGDGRQTRDFTPIANVVHANLLAGAAPSSLGGRALNIGTGERTSLLDLLAQMAALRGLDVEPKLAPPRAGDVMHSVADLTRARAHLGYEPQVDLAAGLTELLR